MSEMGGKHIGTDDESDDVEDWADKVDRFSLSWFLSSMVEKIPPARFGAVEFSMKEILWKAALYGLAYVAGFACGWYYLYDDRQDRVRSWIVCFLLLALFSWFAVQKLLGRYEYEKEHPDVWFLAMSFLLGPELGIVFGAASRTSDGVLRWVPVSVAVLVAVGVLVFPAVMRLVRNRFAAWAIMMVLGVVPSWMLVKQTWLDLASLFWCCVVSAIGSLWFVLDMLGIKKCASTHRDAAFEWLAAWALAFDLTLAFASIIGDSNALMGAYKDDDAR